MIEEVRLPEISENVESGDVINILVKVGDFIEKEQPIVELETEKAAFEVPSPVKGKIVEINIKEGAKVKVGQVIVKVDTETKSDKKQIEPEQAEQDNEELPEKQPEEVKDNKKEETLARKQEIEITDDTEEIIEHERQYKSLPDFAKWGEISREKFTTIRKKIADTLSYTWSNVPQVTQYDKADITFLEEFRIQYSQKVEEAGGKLTITSILLKITALALKEFPILNASLDDTKDEIIYKKYYNISVAVDTDRGLLVPVIRDVDKKSIIELSAELTGLAEKTRQHKISPEDMVGGNFTISNLGSIGGTYFAPIIYWPQVAILGVSRAERQPVYIKGSFEPHLILPLSLSYDHRVIDGVVGIRFLRWIAEALEKPLLTLIQEQTE